MHSRPSHSQHTSSTTDGVRPPHGEGRCPNFAKLLRAAPPNGPIHDQIVRCFATELQRFARHRCVDDGLADDAFQEAMISMLKSLPSYRGDAPIQYWLRRLVVSACSHLRRGRRNDPAFNQPLELAPEQVDQERQEVKLMLAERGRLLHRALAELPEPNRTLLLLHEGRGLSIKELARQHGLTVEGVKSRLKRARDSMRARLQEFALAQS